MRKIYIRCLRYILLEVVGLRKEVVEVDRVWSAIANAALELMKKGLDMKDVLASLNSIRTLINLYDTHVSPNPCCTGETGARIRCELRNLEDMLVIKVANQLGAEYALQLSEKLARAWKG
jgi:hypothetical protein